MTCREFSSRLITSPIGRVGLRVQESEPLSCGLRHFHIPSTDKQSSLVLAIPISLADDSGVAHVLEHLLLTGSSSQGADSFFFKVRAASSAVDMNAVTNSQYLAVHFTCENEPEYLALLDCFSGALLRPEWSAEQLNRETGDASIPGIIANEMAGVFSDRHTRLVLRTYAALFASGSKQFNAGGDPDLIHTVTQTALEEFWAQFFSPGNLIAISCGAIPADKVRARLDSTMSGFIGKTCEPIRSSVASDTFRQKYQQAVDGAKSTVGLGILLKQDKSCRSGIEPILLGMLLKRFAKQIKAIGSEFGIEYDIEPEIRQMDGDYFLFAVMSDDAIPQKSLIAENLADCVKQVLLELSEKTLTELCNAALYSYLTLGNLKAGAGVTASLELLDYFCRGDTSSFGQNSYDDMFSVTETLAEFSQLAAWYNLVEKHIRKNPQVALFFEFEDVKAASISKVADPVAQQGFAPPAAAKPFGEASDGANLSRAIANTDLPLCIQEPSHLPGVYTMNGVTLFHYQLPRPWIATLKVILQLPETIVESTGASRLHCAASEVCKWLEKTYPEFAARVDVTRCRGNSGFALYAALSTSGGETQVMQTLESFNRNLTQTMMLELETGTLPPGGNSATKKTLPPHKHAIYRSAQSLSIIATMKLALHGYGPEKREKKFEPSLSCKVSSQSARVFLCTEAVLAESLPHAKKALYPNQCNHAEMVKFASESELSDDSSKMLIPGSVNHCARSWKLAQDFGLSPQVDAVPYLFATLATNLYLEPVLRGERNAYAASADVDAEIGVLAMFSFRDPFYRETDDFFVYAFDSICKGLFSKSAFLAAKRRTLARLQDKGSIDQRCEKQFDRWLAGYDPAYQTLLSQAVIDITPELFQEKLTTCFDFFATSCYALVGEENRHSQ